MPRARPVPDYAALHPGYRALCLGATSAREQRRADQALGGPKSGRRYDIAGVLQSGHLGWT